MKRLLLAVSCLFLLTGGLMAKTQDTLVCFVLDETGSMESVREQTISAFNEYTDSLKNVNKKNLLFTLIKFNTNKTEVKYSAVSLDKVERLNRSNYAPDACTPLYDAIGYGVKDVEKKMSGHKDMCKSCGQIIQPRVLFVILTDGEENSSKEYDKEKITQLIKDKSADNWTFVYLGSNQDAWVESAKIGITEYNCVSFNNNVIGATMKTLGTRTSTFLNSNCNTTDQFFGDEKLEIK
jgi:hypothetical protein